MKEVVDRIVQYPNRYKLTDAETGQELGTYDFTEVPGTVQQVGTEINKELFDSIEADIEIAGNFDPNGTYPNLTAGEATHAQSADTATTAESATNATQDGQGRNIAATYATKAELAAAGQFDPNGTYPNLTAGKATHAQSADNATNATNATHATSADSATKATQDGQGRNIADTYALKSEVGGDKVYTHYISFYTKNVGDYVICMIEYKSKQSEPYTLSSFVDDLYNDGFWSGDTNNIYQKLFKARGQLRMNNKLYEIMGVGVYYQIAENRLAVIPKATSAPENYTYIIEYDYVVDYVDYVV